MSKEMVDAVLRSLRAAIKRNPDSKLLKQMLEDKERASTDGKVEWHTGVSKNRPAQGGS